MNPTSQSRTAQVAYQDLLRMHLHEATPEIVGSIEERRRNGRVYLYDRFRLGIEMKSRYLGEDSPELRDRLVQAEALQAQAMARRPGMSRLVRILRAEGMIGPDRQTGSLLMAFERAGVFRSGGMLVGASAYALFQGELGVHFDRDVLARPHIEPLSIVLGDRLEASPGDILRAMAFEAVPEAVERPIWTWRQSGGEAKVAFLSPASGLDGIRPLPALGASAQTTSALGFLTAKPIHALALYRSGVLVQIPRPERFAIHKLVVAGTRQDGREEARADKDRA